jgi:hypothetical protein
MSNRQPESVLVHTIRKTIQAAYPSAFIQKNHGSMYMATGIPDLFVFIDGRAYAFEVKRQRPGESLEAARGRCTPIQRHTLQQFRKAGVPADCVLSPAEAMAVIAGHPPFYDLAELPDYDDAETNL